MVRRKAGHYIYEPHNRGVPMWLVRGLSKLLHDGLARGGRVGWNMRGPVPHVNRNDADARLASGFLPHLGNGIAQLAGRREPVARQEDADALATLLCRPPHCLARRAVDPGPE